MIIYIHKAQLKNNELLLVKSLENNFVEQLNNWRDTKAGHQYKLTQLDDLSNLFIKLDLEELKSLIK
jgi:hypothetical protein